MFACLCEELGSNCSVQRWCGCGGVLTCVYELEAFCAVSCTPLLSALFSFFFCVADGVEEEEEESSEDLLKTGHLTQLLEANLAAEVESLSVGDVVGGLERLLTRLRSLCDSCEPAQLQVPAA